MENSVQTSHSIREWREYTITLSSSFHFPNFLSVRRQIRRRLKKNDGLTRNSQHNTNSVGWLFIYNGILLNAINLIKFLL